MFSRRQMAPDQALNSRLAAWRGKARAGRLESHVALTEEMSLQADPALQLRGSYSAGKDSFLTLKAEMPGAGSWFALHISLPPDTAAQPFGLLGYAARFRSEETHVISVALRSGQEAGFVDCFFDKHLLMRPEEACAHDALTPGAQRELPAYAPWRELVFFFPLKACRISLLDLRVITL